MARRPGWYEDPSTVGRFRWWDGSAWMRWVADSRKAPPPPGPVERVVPAFTTLDRVMTGLRYGSLALLALLVLMTALGIVENRDNAPAAPPPAPITPSHGRALGFRVVAEAGTVDLGGVATVALPDGFLPPELGTDDDGLYKTLVASRKAPAARSGPLHSRVWVGIASEGLMAPEYGGTNAGVAAVEVATRAYASREGSVGQDVRTRSITLDGVQGWEGFAPVSYTVDGAQKSARVRCVALPLNGEDWMLWCHAPGDADSEAVLTAVDESLSKFTLTR